MFISGGFRQAVTAGADLVITPAKDVIVADGASLTIQCIFAAGTAVPIDISFNGKFLTESNLAQNSTLHHDSGNSTVSEGYCPFLSDILYREQLLLVSEWLAVGALRRL